MVEMGARGEPFIHPTAIVHESAHIGRGTAIWAYSVVEMGVRLGENCVVGTHTYIGNYAFLGDRTRIMGQCYIPTWIHIGKDVFIGPQVSFVGDKYPQVNKPNHTENPVTIEDNVSVGANSVILPGVTLGQGCRIGAGSVVTKDVLPWFTVAGNPARAMKRVTSWADTNTEEDGLRGL